MKKWILKFLKAVSIKELETQKKLQKRKMETLENRIQLIEKKLDICIQYKDDRKIDFEQSCYTHSDLIEDAILEGSLN